MRKASFSRNQVQTRGQSNNSYVAMCHAVDNARTMTGQERHQPTRLFEWLSFPRATLCRGQMLVGAQAAANREQNADKRFYPYSEPSSAAAGLASSSWSRFLSLCGDSKVPLRFKKHTCPTNAIHHMPHQWPSSSHCNAIFFLCKTS